VCLVDRQVGQIGAIAEIRDRACHAHELLLAPGRKDYVGVFEHRSDDVRAIDWPSIGEGGTDEQVDELPRGEIGLGVIGDHAVFNHGTNYYAPNDVYG
jgi:hypothetical protein